LQEDDDDEEDFEGAFDPDNIDYDNPEVIMAMLNALNMNNPNMYADFEDEDDEEEQAFNSKFFKK